MPLDSWLMVSSKALLWVAALLASAQAIAVDTYVSPKGSDSNDCLSWASACLTLQRGADVAGGGAGSIVGRGIVQIDCGTYTSGASVTYYKIITFRGECGGDLAKVLVSTPGAITFTAEDFAIMTVRDLTCTGAGGICIKGRQFSILDYQNVRFGTMNIHVSVDENSKANCGIAVTIAGPAIYHIGVSGKSTAIIGCPTTIAPGVTLTSFVWAVDGAFVNATNLTYTGTNPGLKVINDGTSLIRNEAGIPGK